jgi:hypothetical protein
MPVCAEVTFDGLLTCSWCDEQLDAAQSANPERSTDGEVVCDDCYYEVYYVECQRCMNTVDKVEMEARPGELLVILHKSSGIRGDLEPGYYRVKGWPFFADGIIEAYFYDDHLERVADLDEQATRAAEHSYSCSIPICAECRQSCEPVTDGKRVEG